MLDQVVPASSEAVTHYDLVRKHGTEESPNKSIIKELVAAVFRHINRPCIYSEKAAETFKYAVIQVT